MNKYDIIKKIGFRIREVRQSKNISILELAKKVDMEYNNIIRLEKGRTNPTIATLHKICQALDAKLSDIVNIEY